MQLEALPYDLLSYIASFLHPVDLVDFSLTNTWIHSCCQHPLLTHQQKLRSLSTITDTDRLRTIRLFHHAIFPKVDNDDMWYHRQIIFHQFHLADTSDLVNFEDELSEIEIKQYHEALGKQNRAMHYQVEDLNLRGNIDSLMLFAVCKMPRLSAIYFNLHPAHNHGRVVPRWSPIRAKRAFWLFAHLLRTMYRDEDPLWPPGLWSLQSIEIDFDELLTLQAQHSPLPPYHSPTYPRMYWDEILDLLMLPNLRKLAILRQPESRLTCLCQRNTPEHTLEHRCNPRLKPRRAPLEELRFSRMGVSSPAVMTLVEASKGLRVLVCEDRGEKRQIQGLIDLLQVRHATTLEALQVSPYLGCMLLSLRNFNNLQHISLTYTDIMENLQQEGYCRLELEYFLPPKIQFLHISGGRAYISSDTATLTPTQESIEFFISHIVKYIQHKAASTVHTLTDICFNDMRVQAVPKSREVGRAYFQGLTPKHKEDELALNWVLMHSTSLRDAARRAGVLLHFVTFESALKECNHPDRHRYKPRRQRTKEELRKRTEALREGAEPKVEDTLVQLASLLSS